MKRLLRFVLFISVFLSVGYGAVAQNVSFKASGPSAVAVGDMFQVSFMLTVDSNVNPESFKAPDFSAFNVIAGPTTSSGFSIDRINGVVSRKTEYTYTYVVTLQTAGTYALAPATITVNGKEYKTQSLPIEAVDSNSGGNNSGNSGGGQQQAAQQQSGPSSSGSSGEISDSDLFLRLIVDKAEVYKNEPVRVYLKLYSRVNIGGYSDAKFPAFNGFWSQDLDTRQYQWQRENYNSQVYDTHILSEYLLYPQQSGELQIDPFEMTFAVQIITRSARQSILDDFFGGPDIQEVSKRVASKPVKIKVKNWPAGAPAGFNGAVGNFTMTTEFPSETINANSSATMTVKISGSGNLPLIQAPKISIPTSFEQFTMKTTESLKRSVSGISGYRQFEYPIIARAEGDYAIDPVRFAFFNPQSERYVSLSSDELVIKVLPDSSGRSGQVAGGIVSGLSKEDVRILGQDIRYIKLEPARFIRKNSFFVWSLPYFLILLLLLAVFIFLLVFLQKRMKEMRNVDVIKGKRANKVALQRLRRAEGYMRTDNQRKFYEEMLQALWGYMSDKLNIPVAILTKDNVREALLRKAVNQDYINRYTDLISECEYAQYSPAESGQMQDIYRGAVETISKLESVMRR